MPDDFNIRLANFSDAALIASQRARMFQEMGLVPESLFETYRARCERCICEMIERAEYVGWLACPNELPDRIVAGAGAQFLHVLPHPVGEPNDEIVIADGRHAIILNVFTEPDWRRRGLATILIEQIIAWARTERLDRLVLHASDEGRPVYERLGFIQTTEMRFKDRLDIEAAPSDR